MPSSLQRTYAAVLPGSEEDPDRWSGGSIVQSNNAAHKDQPVSEDAKSMLPVLPDESDSELEEGEIREETTSQGDAMKVTRDDLPLPPPPPLSSGVGRPQFQDDAKRLNSPDLHKANPAAFSGTVAEDIPQGTPAFPEQCDVPDAGRTQNAGGMEVSRDRLPAENGINLVSSQVVITSAPAARMISPASLLTTKPRSFRELKLFVDRQIQYLEDKSSAESSANTSPANGGLDVALSQTAVSLVSSATSTARRISSSSNKRRVSPEDISAVDPKRLKVLDEPQVTAPTGLQAPNGPRTTDEDLDDNTTFVSREFFAKRQTVSPCVFGFVHGTKKPSLVGSIVNDTPDWQAVLGIHNGLSVHPPGLRLVIRVADVLRRAPINHDVQKYTKSCLQWFTPDSEFQVESAIRSLNWYPFDDWYEQTTSAVKAIPAIKKVRAHRRSCYSTVIECLVREPSVFCDFPDPRRRDHLPSEPRIQAGKARTGEDVMTFILDTRGDSKRNLKSLKQLVDEAERPHRV
ncbi:MAG: hypothetical protein LQ349_008007 [Xanthoria aureola]|nr:MAG: hypothetical protein LQ349_008007 [Xanthoria aureola]